MQPTNASVVSLPSVANELSALLHRLGFNVVVRDPNSADVIAHSPGAQVELLAAEPGDVRVAAARVAGVAIRVEMVPQRTGDLGLTPRQMAVARLLEQGKRNQDIASALKISTHTVRRHLEQMFRRLGVRNRAGAVAIMQKYGHGH
jgi:DNA-binding CsgD family transcriptional regulator